MTLAVNLDSSAPSCLIPNHDGCVELLLVQTASDQILVGTRLALAHAEAPIVPTSSQVAACKSILNATRSHTLTVLSFHPGLAGCETELRMLAQDRTIVGLAGIDRDRRNTTYIATGGTLHKQAKLSLSSEDDEMHVKGGQDLRIFLPPENHNHDALRWATLNCHDYTHVDLLRLIQESRIELLIVVTYNTATRLFWQYAMADMHRLFCYVVVANVAELGGSAVFAPYRRIGRDANAQFSAGGQVFGSRGPGEFRVTIPIDVMGLRGLRSEFTRHGFQAKAVQRSRHSVYEPIAPPEHYMATFDRPAGPPKLEGVLDVPVEWN